MNRISILFPSFIVALPLVLLCTALHAQAPELLPSIGLDAIPDDSDPVCAIPLVTDWDPGFTEAGLDQGITIPDFTLYDIEGKPLNATAMLSEGKPLLLVNGSYTCPVFRRKASTINRIVQDFGEEVNVAVIYTVEAHPLTDTSVYFGYVNTGKANNDEGILYRQPRTYGERRAVVTDMLEAMHIDAPVFIDGPCNEWWEVFGHAPNNAYLIDTSGLIVAKHGWFDRSPNDIDEDINKLLGHEDEKDDTATGTFVFNLTSSNIVTGPTNDVLYVYGELLNTSAAPVEIDILRRVNQMPDGWATSLCTDICLATWVDSTRVSLDPGESQSFTLYFYTGASADTGRTRVLFYNPANPTNRFQQSFGGIATGTSSVSFGSEAGNDVALFPNLVPSGSSVWLGIQSTQVVSLELFSLDGRQIATLATRQLFSAGSHSLPLPSLTPGMYLVRATTEEAQQAFPIHIVR